MNFEFKPSQEKEAPKAITADEYLDILAKHSPTLEWDGEYSEMHTTYEVRACLCLCVSLCALAAGKWVSISLHRSPDISCLGAPRQGAKHCLYPSALRSDQLSDPLPTVLSPPAAQGGRQAPYLLPHTPHH